MPHEYNQKGELARSVFDEVKLKAKGHEKLSNEMLSMKNYLPEKISPINQ